MYSQVLWPCHQIVLLHGSDGEINRDCHESTAPCLVQEGGGPILHPPQHRLLPLDSRAGSGSSRQVPQGSVAAPRVSAMWDLSRQMQQLFFSMALFRLWVDLVPSWHKRKLSWTVFCKLTVGEVERETGPAFGLANPQQQGEPLTGCPAFSLSVLPLLLWPVRLMVPPCR